MAGKEDQIKTEIAVEGEKQYKAACKEIDNSLKAIASEMKVVSATFEGNAESIEAMTAKQDVLNKRLEEQKKRVAAAEEQLEKYRAANMGNSEAAKKLEISLNYAQAAMIRTENELSKSAAATEKSKSASEQYRVAAAEIDSTLDDLSAELKMVTAQYANSESAIDGLAAKQEILNKAFEEQKKKVEQAEAAYKTAVEQQGAMSTEAQQLQRALNEARTGMYQVRNQLEALNTELEESKAKMNQTQTASEQYQAAAKGIDDTLGALSAELKMVTAQYANSESKIAGVTAKQEVLNKILVEQKKKVEQAEAAYKTAVRQQGAMSTEAQQLQRALNEARTGMYETRNELDALNSELEEGVKKSADFSGAFSAMGTGLKVVGAGVAAIGTAMVAGIGYAVGFADEVKGAMNDFEASTGIAEAAANGFEDAMLRIYNNNFGENMDDIAASMATVAQTSGEVDPTKIEELTQNALMLRDTFGFDIQEQMRAVNMLMDQFGLSGEEAFNLIAQGAQNGLDKNGDLLDSINEYSVHFKSLGLDAEDMFNSFANGADAGTFSVDKLGDAVKELGIRVKDGSDGTMQAFKDIGLNADETAAAFAAGGEQAAKAFDDVTTALFAMDDPLAQNAAGVALFGTMWEDLGVEGMEALTNLNGEISTTTDALSKINAVKYDDFGSAMSGLGRVLKTNFVLPIGEEALPALSDFVNELSAGAASANGDISKMSDTFGTALAGLIEDFSTILPQVTDFATEIVLGLVDGLVASLPQITTAAVDMITALVQGLVAALPAIAQAATQILLALIDGLIAALPLLVEGALQIVLALANGIGQALPQLLPKIVEVVVAMVQTLVENIPMLIDAALQLITGLAQGLIAAIPVLIAAIPQIITSLVENLLASIPQIIQAGVQLFVSLIQNLPTIIAEIVKAVPQIVTGIVQAFGSLAYQIVEIGGNIVSGIWQGIQNAAGWLWDQVTGFFGGIVDGIKNFLGIHSPSTVFADIGGNMAAGVGEGFGGGMNTVSADMQGAMGSAGAITAQEAVQAVNDGIIANIGALDGAVSAIVERVTTGLTAQAARFNQIGVDMTKYIASGMTTGTPNITNIIPQIVQSIITAFTAQQPKFTAAGVDIDKAIASGMVQGTPQITAKIPQIIQSILTTINGFVSQFTAAGEEMVRGIWQGFQNMSGWLESKVRSMMREIVAAVEAEMQIASPSKVFAGIGAYMAEGLGEGFAREMQNVEKTIRRATASTVPEPQRPSGRISRNDNAARGVQVVQNIYANETSYAQQQREAAKQFRLIAREVMG